MKTSILLIAAIWGAILGANYSTEYVLYSLAGLAISILIIQLLK